MKIGVTTYWTSEDNYGQLLQCWALQQYLKKLGHEPFLIKYSPIKQTRKKTSILKYLSIKKWMDLLSGRRKKNRLVDEENFALKQKNSVLNKKRGFDVFRDEFIESTNLVYTSINDLRKMPPDADVFISGSDQVWNNPLDEDNTAGWFLDFGKENVRRIAYAASVGRSIEKKECKLMKKYLLRFDKISVREESAKKLIENIGIKDVCATIDPTLLLKRDSYDSLIQQEKKTSSYIFIYVLNVRSADEIYLDVIKSVAKERNFLLHFVNASGYLPARKLSDDVEPLLLTIPEWIEQIKNADIVVTTSFHGVVFSILYHKKFIVLLLKNEFASGNSRIENFLKKLDLTSRIYDGKSNMDEIVSENIDWDSVEEKLTEMVTFSQNFLLEGLSV